MKIKKLISSFLFLFLFFLGNILNASKIEFISLEVSPEVNLLFFDNDPIGGDYFYSTQLRTSVGIGWKKRHI